MSIICKTHGEFHQTPDSHINARNGCPFCAPNKKKTQQQFIEDCIKIHGEKYDYSKSKYVNDYTKVEIICKKHGPFFQKPNAHIWSKQGCPRCSNRISSKEEKFLDMLEIPKKHRQYLVPSTKYEVDGIDINNNTIYEFLGDYWHGNPKKYEPTANISHHSKTKFGDMYSRTMKRMEKLHLLGYNIKYIWESDWVENINPLELKMKLNEYKK